MEQTSEIVGGAAFNALSGDRRGRPRNRLLATLAPPALEALAPHIETVRCEAGGVLFEARQTVTHVYFPDTAGVLLMDVDKGPPSVAGTVGYEGMVGVGVFSGEDTASLLAAVYLPGNTRRIAADAFKRLATVPGPLHQLMLSYAHSFLRQIIAENRCNNTHSVVERCARWLVLTSQRADSAEFPLALELLPLVIGAQRGGVSLGLRTLEERRLIESRSGFVRVLDHRALEEAACDCARTNLES